MRVFNVPASAPFLRTVIAALVDGALVEGFSARAEPERLARATLYLPTRRAGRMAREIFLDVLGTDAVLLPRIVALGDIDEDELAFAQAADEFGGSDPLDLPPRLGELERRLTLAKLVGVWANQLRPDSPVDAPLIVGGPASTLALATDLARLMDDMAIRGVDWGRLDGLVPEALDKYWQLSLEFLQIAKQMWPAHLVEIRKIEPAARRDLLIEAEAARLTAHHDGPVIAAGSTGSMPATAKFLKRRRAAARRRGAARPRYRSRRRSLAIDRRRHRRARQDRHAAGVEPSAICDARAAAALRPQARRCRAAWHAGAPWTRDAASETMRPSNATAQWHGGWQSRRSRQKISAGMTNLAVIEAANPEMEALAIAVAMREARELNKSAALVTPDRALARRVTAALGRWNLHSTIPAAMP